MGPEIGLISALPSWLPCQVTFDFGWVVWLVCLFGLIVFCCCFFPFTFCFSYQEIPREVI